MRITRRLFLASGGTALAQPSLAAEAPWLRLEAVAGGIKVVRPDRISWTILPAVLGRVTWSLEDSLTLAVEGRLPGGHPFSLKLAFCPDINGGTVVAKWGIVPGSLIASPPRQIDMLLSGKAVETPLGGGALASFVRQATGPCLAAPNAAALALDHRLAVRLVARGGTFQAAEGAMRLGSLLLSPAPQVPPPGWRAEAGPPEPGQLFLGTAAGVGAALGFGADTAISITDRVRPLSLCGGLTVRVTGRHGKGPSFPIARTDILVSNHRIDVALATKDRFWTLSAAHGHLLLEGDGTAFDGAITAERGRITNFSMRAALHGLATHVTGADRSRLDLGGIPLTLCLDARSAPTGGAWLQLGERPALHLAAGKASLAVWRAADLTDLVFRFPTALLDLTGSAPAILLPASPDDGEERPESTLVVDLPPQHVMEQSFVRQRIDLPDAGPPLTPAQVRTLRRGGPEAGVTRNQLSALKQKDALADFLEFANRWQTEASVSEDQKPWVGPSGLNGITPHRAARHIAAELRAKGWDKALADLAAPGWQDHIGGAMRAVPLPAVALDSAYVQVKTLDGVLAALLQTDSDAAAILKDEPTLPFWNPGPASDSPPWPLDAQTITTLFGKVPPQSVSPEGMRDFLVRALNGSKKAAENLAGADLVTPVEARLAGITRLAFRTGQPRRIGFTMDELTRWNDLSLQVTRRARRFDPKDGQEGILHGLGLPQNSTISDWFGAVRRTLERPGESQTQIEMPARLHLSPSQDARLRTPVPLPDALRAWAPPPTDPALAWQAVLAETTPSVRAVWTPDVVSEVFDPDRNPLVQSPKPGARPNWGTASFDAVLDNADRWEIMALTSVYGLPVTGVQVQDGAPPRESSQVAFPPDYLPKGIMAAGGGPLVGLYTPRALGIRRLALGGTGGMLDADTRFDPPSAAWSEAFNRPLFNSFSLERWRALITDGWDEVSTVVRRGYLLPFGHLAGLVKDTEPRIRQVVTDKARFYVVEQATRLFIEVTRPKQTFPVAEQPDAGRGCPARTIELLTRSTPDLIDPRISQPAAPGPALQTALSGVVSGLVSDSASAPHPITGMVFWPRTQPGVPGTARFGLSVNGSSAQVTMPLLFIDNVAASDPATMQALCDRYYNDGFDAKTVPDVANRPANWSVMQLGGAAQPYAEEKTPGDCTLTTDSQRWSLRGRSGAAPFAFDPILQGAVQPPVFPEMVSAQVTSRQLQTLTGSAHPPFLVHYDPTYLRDGFASEPGKGELFLIVDSLLAFNMGSNGDRSGGIGRQEGTVTGWDRTHGPRMKPAVESSTPGKKAPAPAGAQAAPPDDLAAMADQLFGESKILGLVKIADIFKLLEEAADHDRLKSLPVLQELTDFEDQLVAKVLASIATIGKAVKEQLPQGFPLPAGFQRALGDLDALATQRQPDVRQVWSVTDRLLRELGQLASTPLSTLADGVRQALVGFTGQLAAKLAETVVSSRPAQDLLGWALDEARRDAFLRPPLPSMSAGDWQALRSAFALTVADPRTWSDPQPATFRNGLASHLDATAANHLADWLATAEAGVLTAALRPVVALANVPAVQHDVIEAVTTVLRESEPGFTFLVAIVQTALAACRSAAAALGRLVARSLPDLGHAAVLGTAGQALYRAAIDLRDTAGALAGEAAQTGVPAAAPFVQALRDWQATLTAEAGSLSMRLDAFADARAALLARIAEASACSTEAPARIAAALPLLDGTRRALIEACLALAIPPVVPAVTPPEIASVLSRAASRLANVAMQAVLTACSATILRADTEALSAYTDAAATLAEPVAGLPPLDAGLVAAISGAVRQAQVQIASLRALAARPPASLQAAAAQVDVNVAAIRSLADTVLKDEVALAQRAADRVLLPLAQTLLARVQEPLAGLVQQVYGVALALRDSAFKTTRSFDADAATLFGQPTEPGYTGWAEYALLAAPIDLPVGDHPRDGLAREADLAKDVMLGELLARWKARSSALQTIWSHGTKIVDLALRATLSRIIDVSGLRQEVETQLASLIPIGTTLTSKTGMAVSKRIDAGIATLSPPEGKALTVSLASTVVTKLDIAGGSPSASVAASFKGELSAFTLDVLEILSINFGKGISYEGGSGRGGHLSAPIGPGDVTFGSELSFLKDLQSVLSVGDPNNGPYAIIRLDNPSIEAGFVINIPVLTLGVTFTNINLRAAVLLPFTDDPARLRFYLGSVEAPFMISAGIYGGSAHFMCEASARGVETMEASFEFGGVGSIGFGPLQGTAYVTTGAYVRQDGRGAKFGALFSAGFTAHVACFSVTASFVLRLIKDAGSDGVYGEGTLTFRFSVGFFHPEFRVSVHRSMGAGFRGGGQDASELTVPGRTMLADASGAIPGTDYLVQAAEMISTSPDAEYGWGEYAAQFDHGLVPA